MLRRCSYICGHTELDYRKVDGGLEPVTSGQAAGECRAVGGQFQLGGAGASSLVAVGCASRTYLPATSAVVGVTAHVDAGVGAVGLTLLTQGQALLGHTNLVLTTSFVAGTTVRGAGVEVDAGRTTQRLCGLTGQGAASVGADTSTGANVTAGAAVAVVGLEVDTLSAAVGGTSEATQHTVAVDAGLPALTGFVAGSTVLEAGLGVNTGSQARSQP